MNNNYKTVEAVSSFKIKGTDPTGTLMLPVKDSVKSVSDWTPLRHAVLLDQYIYWCRHSENSAYKAFADVLVQEVLEGKHPLLEKTTLDRSLAPFTSDAIQSQLGWMAQPENVVMVNREGNIKEFFPNNLMFMTSFQKAEESRRSAKKKLNVESELKELNLSPEAEKRVRSIIEKIQSLS